MQASFFAGISSMQNERFSSLNEFFLSLLRNLDYPFQILCSLGLLSVFAQPEVLLYLPYKEAMMSTTHSHRAACPRGAMLLAMASCFAMQTAQAQSPSSPDSPNPIAGAKQDASKRVDAVAQFNRPSSITQGIDGNLYVADTNNHTIRKITPTGEVVTIAGKAGKWGSADGKGSSARFWFPRHITSDAAGNLYVADDMNHAIRKITMTGEVTTIAGRAGMRGSLDGKGDRALFNSPTSIAVDKAGNLFVTDHDNHAIRKISPKGEVVTVAGRMGRIGSIDGKAANARFFHPVSIAACEKTGNLYVADRNNYTVRKITPAGEVITLAGMPRKSGDVDGRVSGARFFFPYGIATDKAGNVYVADAGNYVIRKITPMGEVKTIAGAPRKRGSNDGKGNGALFHYPTSIFVDRSDNVFVADANNHTIRKIKPTGEVITVAGVARKFGAIDGKIKRLH